MTATIPDDVRAEGGLELSPEFPILDTLRALGAVAVLTTHVTFQTGDYVRHGLVGAMLSRLDIGVALFFVLSGFLLSRPYLARAVLARPHPPTGRYYWKRLTRIYPVYAVSVVVALVVIPVNRSAGVLEWVRSLTLTDVFFVGKLPQGLTQMWSLSVEATFYVVLPLLMLLLLGRRPTVLRQRRILVLLVLGTLLSCWWNADLATRLGGVTSGTPPLWLPAHLTWFLVGIALALVHVLHQVSPELRWVARVVSVGRMPGVCWAAAGGLFLAVSTPLGGPILLLVATPTQSVVKHLMYAAIAGLVILTGVFAPREGRFARTLSVRWLRHLGHISYSTFCIHLVVLHLVRAVTDHQLFSGHVLQIWTLTLIGSLAASEVLYRLVEKPSLRLKNLGGRSSRSDGQAKSPAQATTTR